MEDQIVTVSEFVALVNQTMEFAYPIIKVEGEVSDMRISKNRWVYFNLVDDTSSVRMFGTVYHLQQPIEDGMKVVVKGSPRLHSKYGFSINIASINPSGEGSIKRAFELLKKKLTAEGLFAPERKRPLPSAPTRIGLITSGQAAAYGDFLKIINQRWSGLEILHADVQVQGDPAPGQIVGAIDHFSQMPKPVDVVVITRGGGGAEDLSAFSTEAVARAVAGSRIPTVVGVGHEIDVSLADMAADVRATTPTNAAQLVVPDREVILEDIDRMLEYISSAMTGSMKERVRSNFQQIVDGLQTNLQQYSQRLDRYTQKLELVNPTNVLNRGYALVSTVGAEGRVIRQASDLVAGDSIVIKFNTGSTEAEVKNVKNS